MRFLVTFISQPIKHRDSKLLDADPYFWLKGVLGMIPGNMTNHYFTSLYGQTRLGNGDAMAMPEVPGDQNYLKWRVMC